MLHDPAYFPDIGEDYNDLALSKTAGLMTFRYLNLFSTTEGENSQMKGLSTQADIVAWDAEHTFVDAFIRNESLEEDIFRIFYNHNITLTEKTRSEILALPRTNVSSRSRELVNYYDADTVSLVANREQLIIDRFAYKRPEL